MNLVYQLMNRPLTNIVAIKRALADLVYDTKNDKEAINKGIIQIHNDSFSKKDFYNAVSMFYCNSILYDDKTCDNFNKTCRECWQDHIEKSKRRYDDEKH